MRSKTIPETIKSEVVRRLTTAIVDADWDALAGPERTARYLAFTTDPRIGGVLAGYMDASKVRLYIKDTLMKPLARQRLRAQERSVMSVLGIEEEAVIAERYERPYGTRFHDGRIVCWGAAEKWKLILMAMHEREFEAPKSTAFGVALLPPLSRFEGTRIRALVEDAARKLGVMRLEWLCYDQLCPAASLDDIVEAPPLFKKVG